MKYPTRKSSRLILGATMALCAPFLLPAAVRAADHGDAPSLAQDLGSDINDVFTFLDPNDNSQVVIIATVHGFIVPGEAVNFAIFDPVLRYRFAIENTGDNLADKFIDVTFSKRTADPGPTGKEALQIPRAQTATVHIPSLPGFAGGNFTGHVLNPTLGASANTPVAEELKTSTGGNTGIQFFAGIVDDPFFFDIPAFSSFVKSVREGSADTSVFDRGRDSFAGYNTLSIALRMPVSFLTRSNQKTIGVRFQTDRRSIQTPTLKGEVAASGAFRTVDSMGNPGVNVALIPFKSKGAFNAAATNKIGDFAPKILATLHALGTNDSNINVLASVAVLKGDFLHLDTTIANTPTDKVGGGAGGGSGFPNGRRLRDDTIDILLSLIANQSPAQVLAGNYALSDNVDASISQFPLQSEFPFLAPAQQPVSSVNPAKPNETDDKTQN